MKNEELLQRLLILAENRDKHICELEEIVKAQQRTIDTLAAMAQPVVNIDASTGKQIASGGSMCIKADTANGAQVGCDQSRHTEHHTEHTGAQVTTGTPNAINMNVGK